MAHGEALSIVYPAFAEFTWKAAIPQFAKIAGIMNPQLKSVSDHEAASQSKFEFSGFLKRIGLNKTLRNIGMPQDEISKLAGQCMVLPDYKGNPRVATISEMIQLVESCF